MIQNKIETIMTLLEFKNTWKEHFGKEFYADNDYKFETENVDIEFFEKLYKIDNDMIVYYLGNGWGGVYYNGDVNDYYFQEMDITRVSQMIDDGCFDYDLFTHFEKEIEDICYEYSFNTILSYINRRLDQKENLPKGVYEALKEIATKI